MILGILGSGGLGRETLILADQINAAGHRWDEIVFIDDFVDDPVIKDRRNIRFSEVLKRFSNTEIEMVVALGEPRLRAKLLDDIKQNGFSSATLVHPDVLIPSCTILGDGVIVNRGCFISCDVRVGENTCFQSLSSIAHDSVIEKNCVVSTFAAISGRCRIGEECYLAAGALLREKTKVGDRCILGMGSVVVRDVPDDIIVVGNPARPMRRNEDRTVFK